MRKIYIFMILVLFSGCMPLHQQYLEEGRMPEKNIKIGLSIDTNKLEVIPNGVYDIYSGKDKDITASLENGVTYGIGVYEGSRVVISKLKIFDNIIYLKAQNEDSTININGKNYRGNLYVSIQIGKNKFRVVNELDIEKYLYGVICKEISSSWPKESIKAQAVAARTYALKNIGRHKNQWFDLCDTTHCQVYGGLDSENPETNKIIDATRGEVLTYDGELAHIFYHGNCGGYTESVTNVWTSTTYVPYLKGRRCSYCKGGFKYDWEAYLSYDTMTNKLNNTGHKIDEVKSVKIKSFTHSGRVKELSFRGEKGSIQLSGYEFREIMGYNLINSTKFEINNKKDGIKIIGTGSGHGVGMCQIGAKVMAEKGNTYLDILDFYFPGTKVELWTEIEAV
jgi:stage II sporulation protein D